MASEIGYCGSVYKYGRNLGQGKSIDLSSDQLIEELPQGITSLLELVALNLLRNKLHGRIPQKIGTQLQSFDASAYVGNVGLCGPPLPLKCPGDEASEVPPSIGGAEDIEENGDEFWRWFYTGIAFGFIIRLWGVCDTLFLNRFWRQAYFLLLDNLKNWFYVTMAVHMAKLQREF